jgi:hypothetical protein
MMMMKNNVLMTQVILFILMTSCHAIKPSGNSVIAVGNVYGKVSLKSNKSPLGNMVIELNEGLCFSQNIRKTYTNGLGQYSFDNVPLNQHFVIAVNGFSGGGHPKHKKYQSFCRENKENQINLNQKKTFREFNIQIEKK